MTTPPPASVPELPSNAWSFLRNVLSMGCAIEADSRTLGRTYEQHSAALDERARVYSDELERQLAERDAEIERLKSEIESWKASFRAAEGHCVKTVTH